MEATNLATVTSESPRPAQECRPLQPLYVDERGTVRFRANAIVDYLLEYARVRGCDLNTLAVMDFSDEDREQLAQLIGYSLAGFADLSYVSDETYDRAELAMAALNVPERDAEN